MKVYQLSFFFRSLKTVASLLISLVAILERSFLSNFQNLASSSSEYSIPKFFRVPSISPSIASWATSEACSGSIPSDLEKSFKAVFSLPASTLAEKTFPNWVSRLLPSFPDKSLRSSCELSLKNCVSLSAGKSKLSRSAEVSGELLSVCPSLSVSVSSEFFLLSCHQMKEEQHSFHLHLYW